MSIVAGFRLDAAAASHVRAHAGNDIQQGGESPTLPNTEKGVSFAGRCCQGAVPAPGAGWFCEYE